MIEKIIVTENVHNVIVSSPGPQGVRGSTILNGNGAPASNLGLINDFYIDNVTKIFYGPKPSDVTWSGAVTVTLGAGAAGNYAHTVTWEVGSVTGPVSEVYSKVIAHNLGFYPNVTIKDSAGNVLETGIDYNSINQITLTMAQPFSGTAYLS